MNVRKYLVGDRVKITYKPHPKYPEYIYYNQIGIITSVIQPNYYSVKHIDGKELVYAYYLVEKIIPKESSLIKWLRNPSQK